MSDKAKANEAKARGNASFTQGKFEQAVEDFSEAIRYDPTDHVFWSNRSGAFANLNQFDKALEDAEHCVKLKPDWAKGYSRKGLALFNLKKYQDAIQTYEKGLTLEPSNQALKEGLEQAKKALDEASAPRNPMGKLFGPEMWAKLALNPVTKKHLDDPEVVQKLKLLASNPQLLSTMGADPRISQCLGVIFGLGANFGQAEEGDAPMDTQPDGPAQPAAAAEPAKPAAPTPAPEPAQPTPAPAAAEPEPISEEDQEKKECRRRADAEKELGNKAYTSKRFDEALAHYAKAAEIDPTSGTYPNNAAIVHQARKEWELTIQKSEEAIRLWRDEMADFKLIAKAYLRIGTSFSKMKKWSQAIEAFKRSQLEEQSEAARQGLKLAEEEKKKEDELAYLDKDKAAEAKERGNKLFKENKFADAIIDYTEAIKRDPTNPAFFSNRAACYQKLMEWQRGMEDCESCLKLDPNFVKAYVRKGKIQHFLKQYHKAVETFNQGLAIDPRNAELLEGKMTTMAAMQRDAASGKVDPQRAQEALKDPEIQGILKDPLMMKILQDLQTDPSAANAALADHSVRVKLDKLIAAGILQVGSRD